MRSLFTNIRKISRHFVVNIFCILIFYSSPCMADGKIVEFKSGRDKIKAELFLPADKKFSPPYPGLIAIHEWWGLNDQVRGEAQKWADEGFAVLAVDLYRGRRAADADEAHELMRGLPQDRAALDLKAAFSWLAKQPEVAPKRIGSIGWCMGGGYSLELAALEPKLRAAVIYYGRLITDTQRLAKIKASVYGFFGEDDRGIPAASVREFEETMAGLGKTTFVHIYPGAGHAFANSTRPSYNPNAAEDARIHTLKYLKSDLGVRPAR